MQDEEWKVAHLFADHGTEAEVLSRLGPVTRYTIDPRPNSFVDETVELDLMDEMPSRKFDLAVLHPICTDKSQMTHISGDPGDHENQIPRAREIGREIAGDYVIENKPRDDLNDPVVLNGRMFGLPIDYSRAFETSFPILGPPRERRWGEKTVTPYFYADRSAAWWEVVKGYTGNYPKEHLSKNALPAIYVQTIVRSWLESQNPRDMTEVQDNSSPPPRQIRADQSTLEESGAVTDGGKSHQPGLSDFQ